MGDHVRGGYYKGIDGKFRDANGNVVEERSATSIKSEVDKNRGVAETEVPGPHDPGPLGPTVPADPKQATKNVEKSAEKEGTPGGRKEQK